MYSPSYCAQYRLSDKYGHTLRLKWGFSMHRLLFKKNNNNNLVFLIDSGLTLVVGILEPDTVYFTTVSVTKDSGVTSFLLFKLPNSLTQQPQSCFEPYFSR